MKLRTWLSLTLTLGAVAAAGACASNTDTGNDTTPIACSQGTSQCGDVCISTNNDPNNCGGCAVVCGASEVCDGGACAGSCSGSEATDCGGSCVNTQEDTSNCGTCGNACTSGQECTGGKCVSAQSCDGGNELCDGKCVDVSSDPNRCGDCNVKCAASEVCKIGECVPAGQACDNGQRLCAGACVDANNDANNCGTCGKVCAVGQGCVGGECRLACQSGEGICGDACVKLESDANNCGECGKTCSTGETCVMGECSLECTAGKVECSGLCVDTQTNPQYCGACTKACKSTESCVEGACKLECGAGLLACGASCVNTKTDAKNCGSCGNACSAGQYCEAGACKPGCPSGQIVCGGACVDTQASSDNCGACGTKCGANEVCSASACVGITEGNGALGEAGVPKVALVHTSTNSASDVKTKLTALGSASFATIDLIDVGKKTSPAVGITPTLAQLKAYDAVALFTYLEVHDRTAMGDVLADYLDAAGGVVMFSYGAWERNIEGDPISASLLGRYAADYALMKPQGPVTSSGTGFISIGVRAEPDSPLLADVNTFKCGKYCYRLTGEPIHGGVTVAKWDDGNPLVIRGDFNGHRVAELNFFAGSSSLGAGTWDPATDGARLIKNALLYVSPREISASPRLDLGSAAVGTASAETTLVYRNTGTTARAITALAFSGPHAAEFEMTTGVPLTIPAGGTVSVKVRFTPASTGLRAATLSATVSGFADKLTTLVTGKGA